MKQPTDLAVISKFWLTANTTYLSALVFPEHLWDILWNIPSERHLNYLSVCDSADTRDKHGPAVFGCIIAAGARCLAAEAPECSRELRRRQESAAGGGLPAPGAAGVSAQLRDWCNGRQLPSSAAVLHHRVGKVCEEHPSEVRTNILLFFRRATDGLLNMKSPVWRLSECFKLCGISSHSAPPPTHTHTHREGLRVIPESEIGLAAIYASCDQYCNPSNRTAHSGESPCGLMFPFSLFWPSLF